MGETLLGGVRGRNDQSAHCGAVIEQGYDADAGNFHSGDSALSIIAIFPQQRWMFMLLLSVYIGFCTYMKGGGKYQYFYYVSGFVCVVICFDGGINSSNAFHTVVARVLETGTGILAFELVNILIWPQSTTVEFNESISNLGAIQGQMFKAYQKQMMQEK